jgi:predicted nuclease of predicted toxin-antitoxin system
VKFLIDRCAGHLLAEWLRQKGHDVVESRDKGPDPGDRILLDWAASERRILVTMDKDFGKFVFLEGTEHAGLVRLPDVPAGNRIALMENILKNHSRELSEKKIITVRGGRIRFSSPPVIR